MSYVLQNKNDRFLIGWVKEKLRNSSSVAVLLFFVSTPHMSSSPSFAETACGGECLRGADICRQIAETDSRHRAEAFNDYLCSSQFLLALISRAPSDAVREPQPPVPRELYGVALRSFSHNGVDVLFSGARLKTVSIGIHKDARQQFPSELSCLENVPAETFAKQVGAHVEHMNDGSTELALAQELRTGHLLYRHGKIEEIDAVCAE